MDMYLPEGWDAFDEKQRRVLATHILTLLEDFDMRLAGRVLFVYGQMQ